MADRIQVGDHAAGPSDDGAIESIEAEAIAVVKAAATSSPSGAVAAGVGQLGTGVAPEGRGWRQLLSDLSPSKALGGFPVWPMVVLFALAMIDEMDRSALYVLTPEIRDFFGLDLAAVAFLVNLTGILTLLLAAPVGYLSDRVRRTWLTAAGAIGLGLFGLGSGLAPTLLLFGIFRTAAGLGRTTDPAHQSLLADYYPPESRAAVYSYRQLAITLGQALGPIIAGLIAAYFFWQAAFILFSIPALLFAWFAFRLREPVRGEQERRALGASEQAVLEAERPPSLGESLRVAWNVRSLRRIIYSLPFLLGAYAGIIGLLSLYYDEVFHIGAAERGLVTALNQAFAVAGLVVGGLIATRLLQDRPARVILYSGGVGIGIGVMYVGIAVSPWFWLAVGLSWIGAFGAAVLGPATLALLSLVIPARARGLGLSLGAVAIIPGYLFTILAGVFGDHYGIRIGIVFLVPVFLAGSAILASAASSVAADIRAATAAAMAAQISREAKEAGRAKLLVCNDLDVSYGHVQILFNVDFEVEEGEIIALLGTNGAGKSTLLRAVSGLTAPANGAVFYDGEDITYLPAHEHAARGIIQVPGGKGVFPTLTVAENLRLAAWLDQGDEELARQAAEEVYGYFPILLERAGEAAGNLSGGEQQMLTLGRAFLSRPRLLMIDELSLGLAPAVVEQLLGIVSAIHERGTTIILVEQSVNVALTVAKRAVFMEKGEIRFSGPTDELLARPDILRSVYLRGARGGGRLGGAHAGVADLLPGTDPEAGRETVLEVRNLAKRYGGKTAVNGVSFTLADQQILGLIGPNGAGKTTLFDLITGFVEPDRGDILLFGEDVTSLGPDQRAARGLVRSFQDARLFPALTVAENIAVALERHVRVRSSAMAALHLPNVSRSEAQVRRRVERLIELLALGSTRDKFVRELSTGQRRIVDMACVLAAEPRVLLLDEPSSGIAQREAEELGPLLLRIQQDTGCSILIIEHDMPLIMSVSHELLALELGAVVTRGSPQEVVEDSRVVASYLGNNDAVVNRSGTT